jgi:hypothetical protein
VENIETHAESEFKGIKRTSLQECVKNSKLFLAYLERLWPQNSKLFLAYLVVVAPYQWGTATGATLLPKGLLRKLLVKRHQQQTIVTSSSSTLPRYQKNIGCTDQN